MEKFKALASALDLNKKKTAVRLISMFFLVSCIAVFNSNIPYVETLYADNINIPLYLLFYISGFMLLSMSAGRVKTEKLDKTVMFVSFLLFGCTVLFNTYDVYLFTIISVVGLAVSAYCFSGDGIYLMKDNKYVTIGVYAGLAVAFTVFVGGLTALRYKMYISPCFDFGIFAQMFEYMKATGVPYTTCERDTLLSHLAVHQSYIYYLILPLYYIFPDPTTLNIAQSIILALGVIPLYLLCKKHNLSSSVTLAMGIVYIFYPALSAGCFYDIHENCFLTPFILWLLYFIDCDKTVGIIVSAVLVCLVKEDAPMYVLFIAVYMFFYKKKILKPALILAGAAVYFFAAVWYLNNHGDGAMMYRYANYSTDGGSIGEVIKACVTNPGFVFNQCLNSDKLEFMLQMFLPLGFVPFLSAKMYNYILLGPFMLINLMSNYQYQHSLDFQYNFGVTAILFYLTIINISNLKEDKRKIIAGWCVIASICGMFAFTGGKANYLKHYASSKEVCAVIDESIKIIPDDAVVLSSTFILPHLSKHKELYQIEPSNPEISDRAEYIVTDMRFQDTSAVYFFYIDAGYEEILLKNGAVAILKNPNYK